MEEQQQATLSFEQMVRLQIGELVMANLALRAQVEELGRKLLQAQKEAPEGPSEANADG
jgi:hypothetical protein